MAGPRIRTIKPEWLEDEQLLRAGSHARVLSVALILVADDYGRGRCIPEALAAQVFPFEQESSRVFRESLARLSAMQFVGVYRVRDQQYFELRNWAKHQRVDKPGKPRVPAPNANDFVEIETSGDTREVVARHSGDSRESLAPDLDLDRDLDQEWEPARAHAIPAHGTTVGNGTTTTPTTPSGRASQNLTGRALPNLTPRSSNDPDDVDASDKPPPLLPCWRLWAIWEELAGNGPSSCGPRKDHRDRLVEVYAACAQREPSDPEGLWRRIVVAYVASKRRSGARINLQFLCTDFADWAEQVSRATSQPLGNGSHALRPEYQPFPEIEEIPK